MEELRAKSEVLQRIPVGGIRGVRIEKGNASDPDFQFWQIKVGYAVDAVDATVKYNRYNRRMSSRLEQGKLVIVLESFREVRRSHRHRHDGDGHGNVEITLPFAVAALTSSGFEDIELHGGSLEKPLPELTVAAPECSPSLITVGHLVAQRLAFQGGDCAEMGAQSIAGGGRRSTELSIGRDAEIGSLTATLPSGELTVDEQARVQAAELHLAPHVVLKAPAGFVTRAKLNGATLLSAPSSNGP